MIDWLVSALHDPKNRGKRQVWQDFFLSDPFLDACREPDFLLKLVDELLMEGEEDAFVCSLDPVFLQELSLVWQITADLSLRELWREEQEEGREELLMLLSLQKDPECLMWDEDVRIPDRSDAFYDLFRLMELADEGGLDACDQKDWGSLFYHAEEWYVADPLAGEEYFPEDFSVHREEKLTREEIVEPDSGTVVRMQAYLVRRYRPSLEVCLSMWENYEVEGRLGGYSQVSFEPVLCEMEKLYSEFFETAESELIRWKKELLHFLYRIPEDVERLFVHPVFLANQYRKPFVSWLIHCLHCRQFSREAADRLFACYMDQEQEDSDIMQLLELLQGQLSRYDRQQEERREVFPKEEELEITLQNRHFWTYFFRAAYPFSSDGRMWPCGDVHCLFHCYIEQVFRPSQVWQMAFAGYDQEKERVLRPRKLRLLPGEPFGQVEILFGIHHVEYKIDETPVYEQCISFQTLMHLERSEEGTRNFFLLLPLAVIREAEREQAAAEILRRLTALPLPKFSFAYLTGCLLNNRDWAEPEQDRKKQIRYRCYRENAVYCFRSSLYLGRFAAEVLTPGGWKAMKPGADDIPEELKEEKYCRIPGWDGIVKSGSVERLYMVPDRNARRELLQKITDAYLPPCTVKIDTYLTKGGREQNTALVRRALAESLRRNASGYQTKCMIKNRGLESFLEEDLQGQWAYTTGNVLLHFGKEQNRQLPKVFYFMASGAWKPESVVLSITGQQKKDCVRQEKRLMRRVCQGYPLTSYQEGMAEVPETLFTVCGYFMVEGQRAFPLGIGNDGMFYTYQNHRLIEADDFQRLLKAALELDGLTAVSVCRGIRTTCRLNGKPELWYEYQKNYEDGNYPVGKFRQLMKEG